MSKKTCDQVYHLDASFEGLTLAAALKRLDDAQSWGQVKKWIGKRFVQINGNLCLDEARRVGPKDVVKVLKQPMPEPVDAAAVRVAYMDDHLLVVEKPAGVTSVRHTAENRLSTRRRQLQPTLEELLPRVLAKVQKLRWPPAPQKGSHRPTRRPQKRGPSDVVVSNNKLLPPELQVRAVHRLDRDTSGLMLFARTLEAERGLIALFRRHKIQRQYMAVCHGQIAPQTITSILVRDRGDGVRGSVAEDQAADDPSGRKAITHIVAAEPITASGSDKSLYTQIRCQLETGRTHQIRIHLCEAGHPICGDTIYFQPPGRPQQADNSGAPRQFLHSDALRFVHPITAETLSFKMPLPRDLAAWLKKIQA